MMILRYSPASPFVRKVMITAHMKGLADKIALQRTDTAKPDESLYQANPLAKIPALTLDDGSTLFDSRVICEYVDSLSASPKLFPANASRWPALTLAATADGIMDACILIVYEGRLRPAEIHFQPWIDRQQSKIDRALAALERAPPAISGTPHYGHVTLACALGYLDLRQGGKWRAGNPKLVAWLDAFDDAVPAFKETTPVG